MYYLDKNLGCIFCKQGWGAGAGRSLVLGSLESEQEPLEKNQEPKTKPAAWKKKSGAGAAKN